MMVELHQRGSATVGTMTMHRNRLLFSGAALITVVAIAVGVWSVGAASDEGPSADPRSLALIVRTAHATVSSGVEMTFTGTVTARVQSDIGFRVPGKIIERLVDVGEQVRAGQRLFLIDDADLRLALQAKDNAVEAARASLFQASLDERRYSALVSGVKVVSEQRYEQARTSLDTARAALASAEADRAVTANDVAYATLVADADGVILESMGEPGQVVQAGQVVVRIAHAGPREAALSLPETLRPVLGSTASARIYGAGAVASDAVLRQISDVADPRTRTFDARYVLGGEAAVAPLGSTVVVTITDEDTAADVEVPIGAILDDGTRTGVWTVDRSTSSVHFADVRIVRLGQENAILTGVAPGTEVVALGAHLLVDGVQVRVAEQ